MGRKSVFFDATVCIGCQACEVACKSWNNLPAVKTELVRSYQTHRTFDPNTWTYMNYREVGAGQDFHWFFSKLQCVHCEHAPCEMVCPVGAISHTDAGFVVIDHERCIGCAYCVENCPFGVPKLDVSREKAYKCWGCADRVAAGEEPACVKTCPPEALRFGDRDELLAYANTRLETVRKDFPNARLYGAGDPDGLGELNWFYLLPDEPRLFGLPDHPAVPESIGIWHNDVRPLVDGLFGLGLVGVVVSFLANLGKPTDLGEKKTTTLDGK